MHSHETINVNDDRTRLAGNAVKTAVALVAFGLMALGLALVAAINSTDWLQAFSASYLVGYAFFLSLALGALFFVAIQHVVHAGWSVAVRRLAEIVAANTLVMAVLFLPILVPLLLGNSPLYAWSDSAAVEESDLLQHKQPYLNVPFFAARAIGYFAVWILATRFLLLQSCRQDTSGDPSTTRRMEKVSGPILVLFALTITFASFDWLMSLEAEWFSTIFGLYYFSGSVVGFLAMLILMGFALQKGGLLVRSISIDHYHELGKLLLGFIVFWGYMAFSQYMLIWYANIPEETVWYLSRQEGSWALVSLALLFGHLLLPFFGLLSREVKRRRILLGAWAVWILVFHWIDIFWLVMPTFSPGKAVVGVTDICCTIGVGSVFTAGLVWTARRRALVPLQDPRLNESLAFENSH